MGINKFERNDAKSVSKSSSAFLKRKHYTYDGENFSKRPVFHHFRCLRCFFFSFGAKKKRVEKRGKMNIVDRQLRER